MKSLNSAKKILAVLALAACAVFAQTPKPVVADSAKAKDTAALHAKTKMKDAAVKPAPEPVKSVDSTKAPEPAKAKDTAALHAKTKMKDAAVKPAPEPAKPVDSAKAPEPVKGATILGSKSCDDLKEKIAANIEAKGIKGAVLTVTPKEEAGKTGKIVGSCEGGSKKIVYTKG